jgi:type VI secretion system protein VasG
MLAGIVRLQLDRIGRRVTENHGASFGYDDAVVDYIVSLCNDPDSGGRMIDNIITNTLLPALSREFLNRTLAKEAVADVWVTMGDGTFAYAWNEAAFRTARPEAGMAPRDAAEPAPATEVDAA